MCFFAALDVLVVLLIIAFSRSSRRAALCLVPYLAWILFATALNASIKDLNPRRATNSDPAVGRHHKLMTMHLDAVRRDAAYLTTALSFAADCRRENDCLPHQDPVEISQGVSVWVQGRRRIAALLLAWRPSQLRVHQ